MFIKYAALLQRRAAFFPVRQSKNYETIAEPADFDLFARIYISVLCNMP